jgi:hypothetical protein
VRHALTLLLGLHPAHSLFRPQQSQRKPSLVEEVANHSRETRRQNHSSAWCGFAVALMDGRFKGWSGGGGSRTIAQKSWLGKYKCRPLAAKGKRVFHIEIAIRLRQGSTVFSLISYAFPLIVSVVRSNQAVLERDPEKLEEFIHPLSSLFTNICVLAATSRRRKVKRCQTPYMLWNVCSRVNGSGPKLLHDFVAAPK